MNVPVLVVPGLKARAGQRSDTHRLVACSVCDDWVWIGPDDWLLILQGYDAACAYHLAEEPA